VGIAQVIREMNVDKIYDPSKLALSENGRTVVNQELGIQFYHEFPRASASPSAKIVPSFRDHIEAAKLRCVYLFDRLERLNSSGRRLLFLRATPGSSVIDGAVRYRFGSSCGAVKFLGRIDRSANDWRGDPASWDQALRILQIRLRTNSRSKLQGINDPLLNMERESRSKQ
jgi:hypothetical protein